MDSWSECLPEQAEQYLPAAAKKDATNLLFKLEIQNYHTCYLKNTASLNQLTLKKQQPEGGVFLIPIS